MNCRAMLPVLLVATTLAVSTAAGAQETDEFQRTARETMLQDFEPVVVLLVTGAFGSPADAFSFYSFWDKPYGTADRKRGYAVRKASRTEAGAVWANSLDCAPLDGLLVRLEDVPSPRIDLRGVGRDGGLNIVADGVSYDLWTRWPAWPDATGYSLRMSGNVNTPLAAWTDSLYRDLASCWSSETPGSSMG